MGWFFGEDNTMQYKVLLSSFFYSLFLLRISAFLSTIPAAFLGIAARRILSEYPNDGYGVPRKLQR